MKFSILSSHEISTTDWMALICLLQHTCYSSFFHKNSKIIVFFCYYFSWAKYFDGRVLVDKECFEVFSPWRDIN